MHSVSIGSPLPSYHLSVKLIQCG
uniref:Uncharacterized protein n=1 Tax=Rhizophora mucronata TaxID=61149 RepID=A0A2P2P3C8_RHIMU